MLLKSEKSDLSKNIRRCHYSLQPLSKSIPIINEYRMPINCVFPSNEGVQRSVRFHRPILAATLEAAKKQKRTVTELVNYAVAQAYCPESVEYMDSFKANFRYSFPTRKTGNRYTRKA
jgi:hypothetical protein